MKNKDHSSTEELPDAEELGVLGQAIREIRSRLTDGGPPVAYADIVGYIDGELSQSESAEVKRLMLTYRNWHDSYWEVRDMLSSAENDTSGADTR